MTRPDVPHVLVIGAGPGLGASIARRFGREGFAVTLVARRESNLADLAAELAGTGVRVDTVAADAADPHRFRTVLEGLAASVTPGVVVYNAAVVARDGILDSDVDHLLAAYAVDVLGAVSAAQVFTPAMRAVGAGTFLATSGSPGVHPEPWHASLSLGKAALRSTVSLLHDELTADGVHVTCVTVAGTIASGTSFEPDLIADAYWDLHAQPPARWTAERVFDGR